MTTETTMPPAEPVDSATLDGRAQIDLSTSLPDGECWIPQHLMNEFPMLNYAPCVEIEAAQAVVSVAEPPIPMQQEMLPETGLSMFWFVSLAVACAAFSGGVILWKWANDIGEED